MDKDKWALCRIFKKSSWLSPPPMENEGPGLLLPESSSCKYLPPGFRFHPTDEEFILHYLYNRASAAPSPATIIAEVDIYKFDPWEVPDKATSFCQGEWYLFYRRQYLKYTCASGRLAPLATKSGYWKARGKERTIMCAANNKIIGVMKTLVFYRGRAPRIIEGALIRSSSSTIININHDMIQWRLCRILCKAEIFYVVNTETLQRPQLLDYDIGILGLSPLQDQSVSDLLTNEHDGPVRQIQDVAQSLMWLMNTTAQKE